MYEFIRWLLSAFTRSRPTRQSSHSGVLKPSGTLEALHFRPAQRPIASSEQVSAVIRREGEIVGFRLTDSHGSSVASDATEATGARFSFAGTAAQNETGSLDTCRILIGKLRSLGEDWSDPVDPARGNSKRERGVDCEAMDKSKKLEIQVVRAITDRSFWRELAMKGSIERVEDIEAAAAILRAALEHKSRIPPPDRANLVLAINAHEVPVLSFPAVVRAFRTSHGQWATELGFRAIWVVGPSPMLCERLDSLPASP